MAGQENIPSLSNSFQKGMMKDLYEGYVAEGIWTHARNAVNKTRYGQQGVLAREPSTQLLDTASYDVIGLIHQTDTKWVVFSTNDTSGEIGIFNEEAGQYQRLTSSDELGFKRSHLITGECKKKYDGSYEIYWQDALNPDRYLNLSAIPYKELPDQSYGDCYIPEYSNELNVSKLRLQPEVLTPVLHLRKSLSAGTHNNGAYQVCAAYSIDGIKVTDYSIPSNIQTLFDVSGVGGALEITIEQMDTSFEEFELVLVAFINQQAQARRVGFYSTRTRSITLDSISGESIQIPIEQIPLQSPVYDRSDRIASVGDYLLRSGVAAQPEINFQAQAAEIVARWVAVAYPANYYYAGGNKTSYLRDEVYSFFIRYVYTTGLRSASYTLVGRLPTSKDLQPANSKDKIGNELFTWQVANTAEITAQVSETLADGGRVLCKGSFGYFESTEKYPDNKPEVWGDLCGKPIRLFRFPDNGLSPMTNHFTSGGQEIILLGVEFDNIPRPVDASGKIIDNIVGYEILRGNRDGHKTVVAKGIFNNMREYDVKNQTAKGLYQNYPYNSREADKFFVKSDKLNAGSVNDNKTEPLTAYRKDLFSFHSPDTTFAHPFLSSGLEVKIDREMKGTVRGYFEHPYKHPRQKLMTNGTDVLTKIISVISALSGVFGSKSIRLTGTSELPVDTELTGMPNSYPGSGTFGTALNLPFFIGAKIANIAAIAALSVVTNEQLSLLAYALLPFRHYALQYNSHGAYDSFANTGPTQGNRRRSVSTARYIKSANQSFDKDFTINNVHRNEFVALRLNADVTDPTTADNSRVLFDEATRSQNIGEAFETVTSCYYGAIKIPKAAPYGAMDSVIQIPIPGSYHAMDRTSSDRLKTGILFGGDIYINRYTEKTTMPFFNTWLYDQPDGTDFDYREYINIPYPRYWIQAIRPDRDNFKKPSSFRHLNRKDNAGGGLFYVKNAYFYLFNSGVRDFFVESEINLAHRHPGTTPEEAIYDPAGGGNLTDLFRTDRITTPNFYRYDQSLSVARHWSNKIPWGSMLPRSFDPGNEMTRSGYRPNLTIYSLPQQTGLKRDNWRIFLANNQKEFGDKITSFKSINTSGALILFENTEPMQMVGADQLQTTAGTKITIGDGGLFQQPLQQITNADDTLGYASCQHHRSVINTPHGLYYMSQNTGKIFTYAGSMQDIGMYGMKYWIMQHLPSKLLAQFPDYPHQDNAVHGIGCQAVYDPEWELIYFSKRDFQAKSGVKWNGKNFYTLIGEQPLIVELGDPLYFTDCSWTLSFDPAAKTFVSLHDWQPSFYIPSHRHFSTVKGSMFHRHNDRWDHFGNYYGKDYPFDVEFPLNSGKQITTLRSVEYQAEALTYSEEGKNVHHVLDAGFDKALIHNSEQISGWLRLETRAKNNPRASFAYPILTSTGIRIEQDKEENRFRFNQFFDVTKDRGEFSGIQTPLLLQHPNGYEFRINPEAVAYDKPPLQRKKFRHYLNKVFLRKTLASNQQQLLRLVDTKIQLSSR